eukprot:gnl/Dysnectes_brevis/3041_a3766_1448.p1 GENE.gnl/Dysnectes_brevis/3041_a3766_1448~~gnl/Dysnectes_brevis/3041_a3766_1448.p1  ORF type:complete len:217 (+),score=12.93 gnl/Dysnectes_brevis/3041_a3766_1448:48-698(+)
MAAATVISILLVIVLFIILGLFSTCTLAIIRDLRAGHYASLIAENTDLDACIRSLSSMSHTGVALSLIWLVSVVLLSTMNPNSQDPKPIQLDPQMHHDIPTLPSGVPSDSPITYHVIIPLILELIGFICLVIQSVCFCTRLLKIEELFDLIPELSVLVYSWFGIGMVAFIVLILFIVRVRCQPSPIKSSTGRKGPCTVTTRGPKQKKGNRGKRKTE